MAKSIKSAQVPGAWIVNPKDRGRKSIKSGKVFLNNNDEFEIELFNPLSLSVLADIKLNGQSISKTGLVVKPGQRVYLDCFIDSKKKFIFKTYEIDNNEECLNATEKNGVLEVFFYKEEVIELDNWQRRFDKIIIEKWYPYYYPNYPTYPSQPQIWYSNTGTSTNYNSDVNSVLNTNLSNTSNTLNTSNTYTNSIETGRVESGKKSKQKIEEVDINFQRNYIHSVIIKILPESRKPIEIKKIKNKEGKEDIIGLIKKLSELHNSGILTDDEFKNKKSELLSRI